VRGAGLLVLLVLAGAVRAQVPLAYIQGHFLVVPVRIDGRLDTKFILDTGIGINLISAALAKELGCRVTGVHRGKRMSGQEVACDMTSLKSLRLGGFERANVPVGVFDFEKNHFGVDPSVTGFVGLEFLRDQPFTIDYRAMRLVLETPESLERRRAGATVIPIRRVEHGPDVTIFARLRIAGRFPVWAEVDTGSPSLTLDARYMPLLGLSTAGPRVKPRTGSDETGFTYARYFAKENIPIQLEEARHVAAVPVRAMFQDIIYQALIGDSLLKTFVVTYDLPRGRMLVRPN
jgi:hypothetical protein